jgi:hypothetical protein
MADDADCDGVLFGDDCDDTDPSILEGSADDLDCDGVLFGDDCDDEDPTLLAIAEDGDCDGVTLEDGDCDDGDPTSTTTATDADCDGECDAGPFCGYEDLGTEYGASVDTGSTAGAADEYSGSCGSVGGSDADYLWTAPFTGTWIIKTEGSGFDTVLRIFDPVTTDELECNDDGGAGLTSLITMDLTEGEAILIVVDGFAASSSGTYVLDINPSGGGPP